MLSTTRQKKRWRRETGERERFERGGLWQKKGEEKGAKAGRVERSPLHWLSLSRKIFKNPKHLSSQHWKNVTTFLYRDIFFTKKKTMGHRLALAGGEIPAVAFYGRQRDETTTTTTRHHFSRGLVCVQEWWCVRCCGALFSFFSDV